MKIKQLIVGPVGTNCYFAINEETNGILLVDPGAQFDRIDHFVKTENYKVCAILITHGHFDHIGALSECAKAYGCPVYAGINEKRMLEDSALNSCGFGMGKPVSFSDAVYKKDGEEFEAAGFSVKLIETPGHTPGGVCYYIKDENVLFSGDTLFCEGVGRTDFQGGSMSQLVDSISDKLYRLPDETKVLPGHGGSTTIAHEKANNYYI